MNTKGVAVWPEKKWARRIVEKELKRTVVINDDGRAPSMYDLRIGPAEAPDVAIECVGAVDATFTETWNIGPAKGPLKLSLSGDWGIEIAETARVKVIRQRIETLLHQLEDRAIREARTDHWLESQDHTLFEELTLLGITRIHCNQPQGTGKVNLWMRGTGGAVHREGRALSEWIGKFLSDPARKDVLSKLKRSGAPICHAFVIVNFKGAPWPVESYLTGDLNSLPTQAPTLPQPAAGVWIVSGWAKKGVLWDGKTWQLFDSRGKGIDA